MPALALGVDFGTSGVRLAIQDSGGLTSHELSSPYPGDFESPDVWKQAFHDLMHRLPRDVRKRVRAISLAATSGTLLICRRNGQLLAGNLGRALPYHQACEEQLPEVRRLLGNLDHPAAQASGSVARALALLDRGCFRAGASLPLIRHQADWLMGWLLADWRWGEEGNNLRLGWDPGRGCWLGGLATAPWSPALPEIVPSGAVVGSVDPEVAASLGLETGCRVVAGTTDANAAVLAADPAPGDGITVLGSTLVLKQFVPQPILAVGLSCHRVNGRWLLGGASNTGAAILGRFFSPGMLRELSRQIDPHQSSTAKLRPLLGRGERFPVDDPHLEPILEPRPVSDAGFLQALLEGITGIEKEGWQRFEQLGAPPLQRIITLGGGARNPQWRQMRQRVLGLPILNRPALSAARGMALLARGRMEDASPAPV